MLLSVGSTGPLYVFDNPARILVVDDDPILREFAVSQLVHPGGEIDVAADGEEAWERLETGPEVDLVLTDLEMPRLGGFGLLDRIRTSPRHGHLPVVVITSRDDMFAIDRAYELGATSFVTKPVNWRLMGYQLRYVLRGSRMEAEIRAARDEAREAVELRASLLALLQHETRTPLNAVIGYAEILRAMPGGAPAECVEPIVTSARSLNDILRRIFSFAQVSAEPAPLDLEIVRASHVAEEAVNVCHGAARRAGVTLGLDPVEDDALVEVDVRHLVTALGELVGNALIHGGGGAVRLAVRRAAGGVAIEVRDEGPGIDPERLRLCLEPFGQGVDPLTRARDGLGLGLAITRRIAELHGGHLEVVTMPTGTTARLRLPTALRTRESPR